MIFSCSLSNSVYFYSTQKPVLWLQQRRLPSLAPHRYQPLMIPPLERLLSLMGPPQWHLWVWQQIISISPIQLTIWAWLCLLAQVVLTNPLPIVIWEKPPLLTLIIWKKWPPLMLNRALELALYLQGLQHPKNSKTTLPHPSSAAVFSQRSSRQSSIQQLVDINNNLYSLEWNACQVMIKILMITTDRVPEAGWA